jgi:hypothetical protein
MQARTTVDTGTSLQRPQEDMTFKVPGTGMGKAASVVR